MKLLVLSAALLALAPAQKRDKAKEVAAADPNATVAKAHGGKVWVEDQPIPAATGERLKQWIAGQSGPGDLERSSKEGPWVVNYLAVFRKAAAPGPITVQFFDKASPRALVDQYSPENDVARWVYQGSYELDPDRGFNKGHHYLVKVGQIIKGRFQPYASGELTLK